MLTEIIATDYCQFIQLCYNLYSTESNEFVKVITNVTTNSIKSVVSLYKSAHFDECEIFDLFDVKFEGNDNLKRLYMPETWQGHPLLKSYVQNDNRIFPISDSAKTTAEILLQRGNIFLSIPI